MDWSDRALWLAIGVVIGYIVRTLQEIKKEVHEVDQIVVKHERDEGGFTRLPLVLDAMLIILFAVTIFSAFRVEKSVDESARATAANQAQNERIEKVASCNLEYTSKLLRAVNARTTYSTQQLEANVRVMEAQLKFFRVLLVVPPLSEEQTRAAAEFYVSRMDHFVDISSKQSATFENNDYPTNIELSKCLGTATTIEKEKENDERESGTR